MTSRRFTLRRYRLRAWLAASVLVLVVAGSAPALASSPGRGLAGSGAGYVPGELIVRFDPAVSSAQRADALSDQDSHTKQALPIAGVRLVDLPDDISVAEAQRAFERDPRVVWAEPNARRYAAAVPNDPRFAEQWALNNTGQTLTGIEDRRPVTVTGSADADIDAVEAWDRTTGSRDVKVAIVDSGLNFNQPDLAPNAWRNPGETGGGRETNGIDDDANGFVDDHRGWDFVQGDNDPVDYIGHGSHVAGTIAAQGNDGQGVSGVSWRASLIAVRVLGNTNAGTCADTAAGMAYAVRVGAQVVNASFTHNVFCQAERDVIDAAPGTLFVIAAGNAGRDVDTTPAYPCALSSANIVCVAATDSTDTLTGFSNFGATGVDLAAPGRLVLSTITRHGAAQTVLAENFETALGARWTMGGTPNTWARWNGAARSGAFSLTDSPAGDYANNTDNFAQLTGPLNLAGLDGCTGLVRVRAHLQAFNVFAAPDGQDYLTFESSPDRATWTYDEAALFAGDGGVGTLFGDRTFDLSRAEGRATGSLRFRLRTNATVTAGGVSLDDLEVVCRPAVTQYTGAANEFDFYFGTSMATPHVSGVAALLLSLDRSLTPAELKRLLLAGVDPLPSLAGRTVSGGRLNAARALALVPTVSIADASVDEGNIATTPASFRISLSGPSPIPVTVAYATRTDSAGSADFESRTGSVTFAPGETVATVVVPVKGDIVDEPDELFYVDLGQVHGATIADGRGVGTILDDDRDGTFSCRASALRVGSSEPVVANPADAPCRDARRTVLRAQVGTVLRVTADAADAATDQTPDDAVATLPAEGDNARASAEASGLSISGVLPLIKVATLTSSARTTCAGGRAALSSGSEVVGLSIGGTSIKVAGPMTLALGLAKLHLNQTTLAGGTITRRALFLDNVAPLPDIVVAESKANYERNPCTG